MIPIPASLAAAALAVLVAPLASADPSDFQYVRTQTGAVRCVISAPTWDANGRAPKAFPAPRKARVAPETGTSPASTTTARPSALTACRRSNALRDGAVSLDPLRIGQRVVKDDARGDSVVPLSQ